MSNMEKYRKAFSKSLSIEENKITEELRYQDAAEWDSVGHMELISELEDIFNITIEPDDIIDFNSFQVGIEILRKYGIQIEI